MRPYEPIRTFSTDYEALQAAQHLAGTCRHSLKWYTEPDGTSRIVLKVPRDKVNAALRVLEARPVRPLAQVLADIRRATS